MIGVNHLGVIVTHVEKASKFLVAGLAKNKTASEINRVTEKLFQEIHPDKRKTFTCDNGKEFCGHQELFCYSLSFVGEGIKRAYQWTIETIFSQGNEF
jgi:IS30 family transposase